MRGRGHRQNHALKLDDSKGGGKWGRGGHSIRKNTAIKQRDRKEHLARCSKWKGVGEVMAEHHTTTQMVEKRVDFQCVCVFFSLNERSN